jgi:hypothetical protein
VCVCVYGIVCGVCVMCVCGVCVWRSVLRVRVVCVCGVCVCSRMKC